MWRFVLTLSFVLICCTAAIHAQYIVVGPADDETVIDTSYRSLTGQSETEQLAMRSGNRDATKATAGVSVINLSQLDCSLFPYNCLYVDATDNLGNPVPGLSADSFCLYQDGVPVGNFTVEQLTVGDCITSVCLVVDVSGSMAENHKLDSAKAALHRFVNNMDSYDQTAIVTFSSCWYQLVNFTSNKTTLHNAINGLTASGNTAAFDGIYKGVDITRLQLGTKAVIAFTDGLENRSQSCSPNPPDGVSDNTYKDDSTAICNLANLAGVPIYTFNLGPIENTWYNPQALKAFANGTGGFWGHAPTPSGIDSLYTLIKQRLCSRYYICYTSPDTVQNGDTHWVKVCKKTGGTCSPCDSSSCQEAAPPVIVRTPSTLLPLGGRELHFHTNDGDRRRERQYLLCHHSSRLARL
jgi:VWFA-related protein